MITTRFLRIFSILMIVAVLLGACTGTKADATANPPLRVAWNLWYGYYPLVIASEKGLFEKHGVQVEPVFYDTYSNQAPDLASGMVDGAMTVLSDTLFDSLSSDVQIVLATDSSTGADQVVASADIVNLNDLRGKRIGVEASNVGGVLLVRKMLEVNGLSPSDVTFVEVSPEQVPGAIPSLIDAGYTFEPYTSQSRAKGDTVVFSSADTPGVIVDVLAFRKNITQNRPEDVKAFIAAWFEALQYWQENPDEGNALIAKVTGLKPEEIFTEGINLLDQNANLKAFTVGTDYSSLYFAAQQELQFVVETGDITNPVDVKDLLNPSFLK
jgi:NitT/TauT family transport system substrate-binding protein